MSVVVVFCGFACRLLLSTVIWVADCVVMPLVILSFWSELGLLAIYRICVSLILISASVVVLFVNFWNLDLVCYVLLGLLGVLLEVIRLGICLYECCLRFRLL